MAEITTHIDLEALLRDNPHSDTLMHLLSPEEQAAKKSRRYRGVSDDDWGHRLARELDLDEPTISTTAAVGVYLHEMRPLRPEFVERALDQPRRLRLGEKVVKIARNHGFGHPARVNFNPRVNGILASDASLIMSDSPYEYDLALSFEDQARPIRVGVGTNLAIGDDEISTLHMESLGKKPHIWTESGAAIFQQRLLNSAIIAKLGLLEGVPEFEAERDEVLEAALAYTDPETDITWSVDMLPNIHALSPEAANTRIEEIARSRYLQVVRPDFMNSFSEAVATIRTPMQLFSLGRLAAEAARARAKAEIYEIAAGDDDFVPLVSPEWE
jgi:hypothetical protein